MSESSSISFFIEPPSRRNLWQGVVAGKLACGVLALLAMLIADVFAQDATNDWVFMVNSQSDSAPAIAPDGTIYFGTFDGRLWAVNPDGSKKWAFRAGREIKSSPAVAEDGTIYFGCRDRKLYAVGADGRKKWEFKTGAWVDSSPALAAAGAICFGSWDGNFYALRADGSKWWEFKTGKPVVSSPAIGQGGTVYFGSHDARLYAVSPEGNKLWEFRTGGPVISSPALDWEGRIYFTSVDGFLYALNGDGALRWKLNITAVNESSPVVGLNGNIFVGGHLHFHAISAEGKPKWERGTDRIDGSAATATDGSVYFVYRGGQLVCYDQDLGHKWVHYIYPCGSGSPAISNDGTIYLPGMTFGLVAVRAHSPVAKTPWPKFRGNSRNTGNLSDCPR